MKKGALPVSVEELAQTMGTLPGIGPKMAARLAVYLAHYGKANAQQLVRFLQEMLDHVVTCERCGNLAEEELCSVCQDDRRNKDLILVVENPHDLIQIEASTNFDGYYVVLGKLISPVNGVGPEDTNIKLLKQRVQEGAQPEIILALSSTVEGEATSLYIANWLRSISDKIKITRLAKGLPTGASIEYLDESTLTGALDGRVEMSI